MLLNEEMEKFMSDPKFSTKAATKVCQALFQEHRGKYEQALESWTNIKTKEACIRTVQILKKSGGMKTWIEKYGKRVFMEDHAIGLKLFTRDEKEEKPEQAGEFGENYDSLSMTNDEILQFLGDIENDLEHPMMGN